MNYRKLSRYLFLLLLTAGAGLILGFLSFGGIFAVWPILPLAIAAFALSVGYESEIYFQNIKQAFKKLFKRNYLERETTKSLMLEHLKDAPDEGIFKRYQALLEECHKYEHFTLNTVQQKKYDGLKKELSDIEKLLMAELFKTSSKITTNTNKTNIRTWLSKQRLATLRNHQVKAKRYQLAKIFSLLAGLFMCISTSYLLIEACLAFPIIIATIPFTFWPLFIIPLSIVAGLGYGFLTFNTVTDMINNDTLVYWYKRIKDDFLHNPEKGLIKKSLMAAGVMSLILLAAALTVCTAGTWWTIITNGQPLFNVMTKLPTAVIYGIGLANMLFIAAASLFFNLENTSHTLKQFYDLLDKGTKVFTIFYKILKLKLDCFIHLENTAQKLNPFKAILTLTFLPLRVLLFIGHLLSIGAGGDRVPFIPVILAFIISIVPEALEDWDYFFKLHELLEELFEEEDHKDPAKHAQHLRKAHLGAGHGHDHGNDIPTKILTLMFYPIILLSALWDSVASQSNPPADTAADHHKHDDDGHHHHEHREHHHDSHKVLKPVRHSFKTSWNIQLGKPPAMPDIPANNAAPEDSNWTKMRAVFLLKQAETNGSKTYKTLRDNLKKPDVNIDEALTTGRSLFKGEQAKFIESVRARVSPCA